MVHDGREDSLVRGLLTGIAAFRWLAWAWMTKGAGRNDATARWPAGVVRSGDIASLP